MARAPTTGDSKADAFLRHALDQDGDVYVFGSEAALDDADPDAFDCSEIVQWSAHQVGVEVPDGSFNQYLWAKERGYVVPVDEAVDTPGALLFHFSSEPVAGGGRPSSAHVAISLGDGNTIEARGSSYGVGSFESADRFNFAVVIPELAGGSPEAELLDDDVDPDADEQDPASDAPDADQDDLPDPFEIALGTDPAVADTDHDGLLDGLEALSGIDATQLDTDQDGIGDAFEIVRLGTNPLLADTDLDGTSDSMEHTLGEDPLLGPNGRVARYTVPGASAEAPTVPDQDRDGMTDRFEAEAGTDPRQADTDHDALGDDLEVAMGSNPLVADTDHDGLTDGFESQMGTDIGLMSDGLSDGLGDGLGPRPMNGDTDGPLDADPFGVTGDDLDPIDDVRPVDDTDPVPS